MNIYKTGMSICGFMLMALSIQAQHAILKSFIGVQQDDKVFLRWTIKSGEQCDGVRIFRATDTVNFRQIGEIPGVCGSSINEVSYTFYDENPAPNRTNYYRLEMGNQGFSTYKAVEYLDLNAEGFALLQNPVYDRSKILFKNPNRESYRLEIHSLSGKPVYHMETNGNSFMLNAAKLPRQLLIFRVWKKGTLVFKGKLVVK
ncbi:MAG: hypothetical protein K9I94_12455 [Bacteroidales bacterium]|nr:hypothetical protein [Bacteroidales bacterium]